MTWIVVVGSTFVMLLWILIYSFFMSADFVDEVLILFGGVQFWVTVLITALLALGMYILFFALLKAKTYISLYSTLKHPASPSNLYRQCFSLWTRTLFGKCGSWATSKTSLGSNTGRKRRPVDLLPGI